MRKLVFCSAFFVSGLALAQVVARFGAARFGEAVFGAAASVTHVSPIPFIPLWATILLAVMLWVTASLMEFRKLS